MLLSEWAEKEAEAHLVTLGNRWAHSRGVADQARRVGLMLDTGDRDILTAAAFLHDIGYAPELAHLGFHPIDGARHLRDQGYDRLSGLVARHTAAEREAALRHLSAELDEFCDERSEVSHALTYCDLTVGPKGQRITPEERLQDIRRRYGPEHVVSRTVTQARTDLLTLAAGIEDRLRESGLATG